MSLRKRTWTILGGGMALALTVTAAEAAEGTNSANYMLPRCRAYISSRDFRDPMAQGYCAGALRGMIFMGYLVRDAARDEGDGLKQMLCLDPPKGSTGAQMVRVVVAYIEARPERMEEGFHRLALEALRAAWPCK